jgi:MEMO1 family protein
LIFVFQAPCLSNVKSMKVFMNLNPFLRYSVVKMMVHFSLIVMIMYSQSCNQRNNVTSESLETRPLRDTIGFAQYPWQMDSLMSRMKRQGWKEIQGKAWKVAVCPHDDYTYVGTLYPELLQNVKAPNLILLGVAHKAAMLGIEDSLVFDSYSKWKGPWKDIPVSKAREQIFSLLKRRYAVINDTLQKMEHSVEAMIPYLQYFNKNISIVSILVPAMSPDRMQECGRALADAIREVAAKNKWEWGKDYAIVVTTDAVHYGNEDWGGVDRAYYGCDNAGNSKAREHESEIIDNCFNGYLTPEKIRLFNEYTLNSDNFREYKWTWCGRYCVPVALYTSYFLNGSEQLSGSFVGYSTSITSVHVPVDDLKMGITAIATDCHWVGYAALGYR